MIGLDEVNAIVYPDYFWPAQWRVLRLRLLGYTGSQIADELGIKLHTAYDRMLECREILGLTYPRGNKELMEWAAENGLITINF